MLLLVETPQTSGRSLRVFHVLLKNEGSGEGRDKGVEGEEYRKTARSKAEALGGILFLPRHDNGKSHPS